MINTWHLVPIIRSRNLNTSAHCMVVLECARGTQYSQALDITMLYSEEKQSKSSFCSGQWFPMTSSSLLVANTGS